MFKFSIKNLLTRKTKNIFIIISIIVSTAIILLAYNISNQIDDGITTTASYYDILVGPNGSSTDLVLNTMFFTGTSSDTISYEVYEELQQRTDITEIIPFATGDSYNSYKIIGTDNKYLQNHKLLEGKLFGQSFEITIGAEIAKKFKLSIGDSIIGTHGIGETGEHHDKNPYTVVGILERTHTAYDNAIFTTTDSVWKAHSHEEEHSHATGDLTAILIKSKNVATAIKLTDELNGKVGIQAVNPSSVLRGLLENIDITENVVYILCAIISIMSIIIIYMITSMLMQDSKKDIILMRMLGLNRKYIFGIMIIQTIIITIIGIIFAFILTRIGLIFINNLTETMGIIMNYGKVYDGEYIIMAGILIVCLLPTMIGTISITRKELG